MNNQTGLLIVSSSPHIYGPVTVPSAMRDVLIALLPAFAASVYFFRVSSLMVILTCVLTAVISEAVCQKIMKKELSIYDNSAVVTGVLLAFTLPPSIPLWTAAIGAIVAIVIGKQVFGGLGNNIFNPALVGRAVLTASWPVAMTTWTTPIDAVSTATPMGWMEWAVKNGIGTPMYNEIIQELPSLGDMLLGNISGSLGETSAIALLLGGVYLYLKGHICWRIPVTYLATVFGLTAVIGLATGQGLWFPAFHILGGGLMLGSIFMATDWVTSPITKKGKIIFGLGCGILTVLIRLKGGYPEGVCYSILLMNMLTPLIDRYTKARVFGRVEKHA